MKKSKVFLTAGHRGEKTGAVGYIDEGAEAIELRNLIKTYIGDKLEVIVDNRFAKLSEVIKHVNRHAIPNDIVIDLHFNSFSKSTANGTEVLIPDNPSKIEESVAKKLTEITAETLSIKNRGVKKANSSQHSRLAMLQNVNCNTMIFEVCFISNKNDSERYKLQREVLAENIANYLISIL